MILRYMDTSMIPPRNLRHVPHWISDNTWLVALCRVLHRIAARREPGKEVP